MICIYQKGNTDYTKNGDAVLNPISAMLTLTINGAWQLTIEHPYDAEGKFEYLVEDAVVRVDVLCINELETAQQRFRIYNYVRNLHSVTAIAFPIAMESTYDAPVDNIILQNATGQQAMAALQQKTNKYTLSTDITAVASTSWANTNVNSAIAGSSDNTFLKVWGGEILYDNLKYKVRTRLGSNVAADHKVTYGNNLESIEYKKDDSGLITRIYPISKDGIRLNGTGYVDSEHISDYAVPHARYMEAPYSLVSTSADDPSSTAQLTRQAISAVNSAASSLSQSVYATAKGNGYQPEYIKTIRSEIVSAVQTMALQNVISTSLYNAMASTIASAMDWMKDLKQPKWGWMGSDQSGWKYGDATSYAKNMYVKIGKTWSYFGNDGNWQEPKDSSDEWDWHDAKNGNGKQYGNFKKYFAHNEYVYITQSGTIKEYWFNEQGWFEESESGDSDYYWHGSGTGADPYWFGASSSDYLKSCWRFIDGTYYFFDSYGYVAAQKDNYRWDWVENGDSSRAWFGNAEDSEYAADYLTSQWEKINGTWYYFDANGIVESETVSQTRAVALFTTGMASLTSTVDNWKGQLYTLLYNLMRSYCAYQYRQGVDIPSITISVNMVELSQTTEYEGYEHLETIKLGDSVQCNDYQHGISTINRVVGITYDCIFKKIASVVLGVASATVQQMVGNANGQAVAGGFDTSALETQLTALRNGKQNKLTAGDGISIVNDVISATGGGGSNVYYGSGVPSSSLGSNRDLYLRTAESERVVQNYSEVDGGMVSYEVTALADNVFNFAQVIRGNSDWDHITYPLHGLVEGKQYTISFDFKFTNATFYTGYTNYIGIDEVSGARIELPTDNNSHSYSFTFTAEETNNLVFSYPKLVDYNTVNADITNFTISGEFGWSYFSELYGKIEDEWRIYKGEGSGGGSSVIANPQGTPTDTLSTISIDEIIYELEQTEVEANPSGTATTDLTKLGIDGTIYDIPVGSEVEANPTDTATDTLLKLEIDGVVYEIPQGGGGGLPTGTKKLWSGDFIGSGDITVPNLSDWLIVGFCNYSGADELTYMSIGTPSRGGSLYGIYEGTSVAEFGHRFAFNSSTNTLTVSSQNRGIYFGGNTTYQNNSSCHIYAIYGLVKKRDSQVQADWEQTDSTEVDYIKNKPTLATVATTGDYDDLTDKPNLATVATSGDYDDLTNKPTIPAAQVNSDWNSSSGVSQILNKPTLATVATSGAYSDLSGTPSLATVATSGSYSDLSNKPTIPSVEANPSGTGSVDLSKLEVDGTIYNIPSGGGSDLPLTVENGKLCIIYET